MPDEELFESMLDRPIGVVEFGGEAIGVAVPGDAWAIAPGDGDYVALVVHDDGATVVYAETEHTPEFTKEYLSVCIPIARLSEVRALLDEAEAIVRNRIAVDSVES